MKKFIKKVVILCENYKNREIKSLNKYMYVKHALNILIEFYFNKLLLKEQLIF